MNTMKAVFCSLFVVGLFSGCAEFDPPKPAQLMSGEVTTNVKPGMTKKEIVASYGEPDSVSTVASKEWGGSREEWYYKARMNALPVSTGYLGNDLYVYFDGESVTNVSTSPKGKAVQPVGPDGQADGDQKK